MASFTVDKQPKHTIKIDIKIPWQEVLVAQEKIIDKLTETVEIKGFRKGKAPKDLVRKSIEPEKLLNEILSELVPTVYSQAVSENNLKPIMLPQIHVEKVNEGEDWELHAITAEMPEINLGDFKDKLKGELASANIWTPASAQNDPQGPPSDDPAKKREEKLNKTIDWLLKNIQIEIPELLLDEETNRMLARQFDQLQKLGLTAEQYLASRGKTAEQNREEFRKSAEDNIKIDLILNSIAQTEKTAASEEDVNKWIENADPETKGIFQNPSEKTQLKIALTRQKTLDFLIALS
jgi:FKBP-type peptidyl-prolyl cis-trans isomerase (trigger factor)